MGARGPVPTPSALKRLRGTFRSDRAGNEPVAVGKPSCPGWLKDTDARKEYRRLVRLLSTMGVLGAVDGNALTRYVLTWVRWRRIVQTLEQNSAAEVMVLKDGGGKVKMMQVSALHSVARSLADELGRLEAGFGMTPSARSRINVIQGKQQEPGDAILGFIGHQAG